MAEGRGWVHAESGTYHCPGRSSEAGDGYAMPVGGQDFRKQMENYAAAEYDRGWSNATEHYEENTRADRARAYKAGEADMKKKIAGLVASA